MAGRIWLKIPYERIPLTRSKVVGVVLIAKGLALKRDVVVSFVMILVDDQPDEVFQQIEQIEWNQAQLQLLAKVNLFVMEQHFSCFGPFYQNERKKRHPFHMKARSTDHKALKRHSNGQKETGRKCSVLK